MRFTGLSEFVVFGLLFAAFILFNLWMQRRGQLARRQRQQEAGDGGGLAAPPPPPLPESLDVSWGRRLPAEVPPPEVAPLATAAPRPAARPAPPRRPASAPRRTAERVFRSRQGLRQAVVAMTVLGPCRALEPYAPPSGEPGAAPADGRRRAAVRPASESS